MPSPRDIAKQVNDSSLFAEPAYDADAGVPSGVASQGKAPDYAANPVNPPAPPAPVKNLKG